MSQVNASRASRAAAVVQMLASQKQPKLGGPAKLNDVVPFLYPKGTAVGAGIGGNAGKSLGFKFGHSQLGHSASDVVRWLSQQSLPGQPGHLPGTKPNPVVGVVSKTAKDFAKRAYAAAGQQAQYDARHPAGVGGEVLTHPGKTFRSVRAYNQRQTLGSAAHPGRAALLPAAVAYHTAKALIEHPSALGPTAKQLAMVPLGVPAGVVETAINPGGAAKRFAKQESSFYKPLLRGHAGRYEKQIAKHGAAQPILDLTALGTGEAAVLGRAGGNLARAGALGRRARRFATAERPHLRISGGYTRRQKLSPSLVRAAAQRAEDRLRAAKLRRSQRRPSSGGIRGIQPHGRPIHAPPRVAGGAPPHHEPSPRPVKRVHTPHEPALRPPAASPNVREVPPGPKFRAGKSPRNPLGLVLSSIKAQEKGQVFRDSHGRLWKPRVDKAGRPTGELRLTHGVRPKKVGRGPSDVVMKDIQSDFRPNETMKEARQRLNPRVSRLDQLRAGLGKQKPVSGGAHPGEVIPIFQKRAQRIATSRIASRGFHAFQGEHGREINQGAMRSLGKLNKHQRQAVSYPLQGITHLTDPVAAVKELRIHRQQIIDEYARTGRAGPPPELKTLDYTIQHADQIFNKKMGDFHQRELARSGRVGHGGVSDTTAQARAYRPQAQHLGIPYTYHAQRDAIMAHTKYLLGATKDKNVAARVKLTQEKALKDLATARPELDRKFVTQVKAAAKERGLPEPVYFQHFKTKQAAENRTAHTVGGRRAAATPKESQMTLFRQGRAVTTPQAYVTSLGNSIRRKHNWPLVANQAEAHAFPNPSMGEIQAVFGHTHVNPTKLTADQWHQILQDRNWNPADYALWNPGRFKQELSHAAGETVAGTTADAAQASELTHAANQSLIAAEHASETVPGQGYKLIPREAYNEIHSALQLGSRHGRVWDKLMGMQSTALLGTNPAWEMIQIGANSFQTGIGMRGNVANFVKSPVFWRSLPKGVVQQVDDLYGVGGLARAHGRSVHLGATASSATIDGLRAIDAAMRFKAAAAKNAVPIIRELPSLHPVNLMFGLDEANNRFFAHTMLYDQAKREAFRQMANDLGHAYASAEKLKSVFSVLPSKATQAQMEKLLKDPTKFEQLAEATRAVLGDYTRYTAKERGTFKRYVLFYGFMRWSLRTLFHTMPVQHPVVGSIIAELAQLHNNEVRQLLGGNYPLSAFSKIFTDTNPKHQRSIDLARQNPVVNPVTDLLTSGPRAIGSFISPVAQILLDQGYKTNLFTGQPYTVRGHPEFAKNPNVEDRTRIALGDALSLIAPYRTAMQALHPEKQTSDALLWSPRPVRYKNTKANQKLIAKQKALTKQKGSPGDIALQSLVPYIPRPDISRQLAIQRRQKAQKHPRRRAAPVGGLGAGGGLGGGLGAGGGLGGG